MPFLLDANIISYILRAPDSPAAARYEEKSDDCFTSIIVAAELRYGIAKHPDRKGARDAAGLLDTLIIAPFDVPAERHYGTIRSDLERRGQTIGANDLLIAAHALALDATLVTANEREFRRVPNLKVENWAV